MNYSTRQREVILNVLRQAGRPLTPQDIREQASQDSAGTCTESCPYK
jgi:Fe2+ or Zn2+ uptake regulation protein